MNGSATSALLRCWMLCLLAGLLWCGAALAQPATATSMVEAADRQALLERLREAQTRLTDLEQNIRDLERRLEPAAEASAPSHEQASTTAVQPAIPVHWLWMGVLTIVILMIGITYSGRPAIKNKPPASPPDANEMARFQARLGRLDLSLDPSPQATPPVAEPDRHGP